MNRRQGLVVQNSYGVSKNVTTDRVPWILGLGLEHVRGEDRLGSRLKRSSSFICLISTQILTRCVSDKKAAAQLTIHTITRSILAEVTPTSRPIYSPLAPCQGRQINSPV